MLSKSDYKYYEKAKTAADLSDYRKTHIGCIAVYQGNVIGIGCNTIKTHPIQMCIRDSIRYIVSFWTIHFSNI